MMNYLNNIKAIAFDFDGTLADSQPAKRAAWRVVFDDRDGLADAALQKAVDDKVGNRVKILETAFKNIGEATENISALVAKYSEKFDSAIQRLIIERGLFAGTKEMLERLYKKYPLYIISGTPATSVAKLSEALGITSYFRQIYGAPATKAENLQNIATALGVLPSEILMVSDDLADLVAAESFGAQAVGIPNSDNNWSYGEVKFPLIKSVAELARE